ncbi:MAG: reverse transcriptase/maturase family protein [Candidatus Portnoybacteria bacterium]|nr:reverse transcriptase/maturase family protein [Candidatus Portnoybacteria bacterium]MDD4982372.1 reverse transcriptase/maturase family protein [Candidatus Portnoybacteria bacterium]
MKIQLVHKFEDIINIENLLEAWKEFLKGKKQRKDVQEFSMRLMDNIFSLHNDLINHTYKHGGYQAFKINDPKPRNIHKAGVRDRLLHHAIYRILYPFFDKTFIVDSYSCRLKKGTHKVVNRFREFVWKVSKNNTKTCWVLKCDIRKFFANIDHKILVKILKEYIPDENIIWLLEGVVDSFPSEKGMSIGLPLGNLTSQLFVNIYMNKFDQFAKHKLKDKRYIRYADDFVFFSDDKKRLEQQIEPIRQFLRRGLKLELHPDKIFIKTLASGVDFLGLVNFPDYRILRTKTRRRMFKNIKNKYNNWQDGLILEESFGQSLQSYSGMLKHCNGYDIVKEINKKYL